jgi:hypothetical protein
MSDPLGTLITQAAQPVGSWPGGSTRAIYSYPAEPGQPPASGQLWVGTATIERAAPYSHFVERTRLHMPVSGRGIRLYFQDPAETVTLASAEQYRFAGDRPVRVELIDGPILAFNLILQPGVEAAAELIELGAAPLPLPLPAAASADPALGVVRVAYAVSGALIIEGPGGPLATLQPGDAYVLHAPAAAQPPLAARAVHGQATAVSAMLWL